MERLLTFHGRLRRQSDKAWLVEFDASSNDVWLPKSQVEYDGGSEFTMPEWLAKEKDLGKPGGA